MKNKNTTDKPIWYVDTPDIEFHWDRDKREYASNDPAIFVDIWGACHRGEGSQYLLHLGDKKFGFQEADFSENIKNYKANNGNTIIVFDIIFCDIQRTGEAATRMFGNRYKNTIISMNNYQSFTNTYHFKSEEEQRYVLSLFAKARTVLGQSWWLENEAQKSFEYSSKVLTDLANKKYIKS